MKLSIFLAGLALGQDDASTEVGDDICHSNGEEVPCEISNKFRSASEFAPGTDADRAERRYVDLKEMATKLWAKNGLRGKKNGFDERKYWAYGCHCFLLGKFRHFEKKSKNLYNNFKQNLAQNPNFDQKSFFFSAFFYRKK